MKLRASAPGKLVLLGEYAVLEGAPALVMAADRRATAELTATDGDCVVEAPEVLSQAAAFELTADGVPQWRDRDPEVVTRLQLVTQVMRALAEYGLLPGQPFHLKLDSAAFFLPRNDEVSADGELGPKLGLGSSAAMTTALASVLTAFAGHRQRLQDRAEWLRTLLEIHRRFQHGRGSGADVAAAVYGGVIRFQLQHGEPRAAAVNWPETLRRLWVWSGQSASTSSFLQTLDTWREHNADAYAQHMHALTTIAMTGADAAAADDALVLQVQLAAAAGALHSLGEASKIPIFSAEHRAIAEIVKGAGGVYKPCGAGGGDLGLAVAVDETVAAQVNAALAASGYRVLDLGVDSAGLVIEQLAHGEL